MDRKQFITGLMALGVSPSLAQAQEEAHDARYTANEITQAGADFFGVTTEAMAKAVQHVFGDLGEPDAYIKGDEGSGAFIVGLRYGSGWLIRKDTEPKKIYWKGPSVGFDFGGNLDSVQNLRCAIHLKDHGIARCGHGGFSIWRCGGLWAPLSDRRRHCCAACGTRVLNRDESDRG